MRAYDILAKKRDKQRLEQNEIQYLIENYVAGGIPDYQMSAFLMAAYINGLDQNELLALTQSMIDSGDVIDLGKISGVKVDKHSTGGVGDKTTLVVAPLVASLGIPVAKMSGRGLGHTGGTLDKLESIPGFRVDLSPLDFIDQVKEIGVAIASTSNKIVPADHKLYALRDVTATVSSIPLIAASVVSKKFAGGADVVIFDVKCGSGAFLKSLESARALAGCMTDMMKGMGKSSAAVISNMNQPLGFAIGNSLEVAEAIDTLKGCGPKDLKDLCLILAANLLILANKASNTEEAILLLENAIADGRALAKLEELISAQGGDSGCIQSPGVLPQADFLDEVRAKTSGYITCIDAETVGRVSSSLGAGRQTKESNIDLSAGIILTEKVGDRVTKGDLLAKLFSSEINDFIEAKSLLEKAIGIEKRRIEPQPLIYDIVAPS